MTDAALSRLGVEDLLDELLDRVCDILRADTAAVLLLDQSDGTLVTTATRGVEAEVDQSFRLDVGRGFAGRVARDREPVVLDRVHEGDVVSPVLRARGIRSLLGVPMITGGRVVGVLHVGSTTERRFTPDDVQLLRLVADRVTLATQTRLGNIDRTAALALQRSLLPGRLPAVTGVDLAARYVPGQQNGVGGDWYDVFNLPSGWLGVVVGDVSGHGLRAAVVMGRLRSALRAYALECDDPADALTRLDRKVHHFETGNLTSVLYVMVDPARDRALISLAGHLPPVLAAPDRPAELLRLPVDPPLGTGRPQRRRNSTFELAGDVVLVCYTDGLVERRDQVIDAGLDRLCRAVEPGTAEETCANVMARLSVHGSHDDIALLVVRRRPAVSEHSDAAP